MRTTGPLMLALLGAMGCGSGRAKSVETSPTTTVQVGAVSAPRVTEQSGLHLVYTVIPVAEMPAVIKTVQARLDQLGIAGTVKVVSDNLEVHAPKVPQSAWISFRDALPRVGQLEVKRCAPESKALTGVDKSTLPAGIRLIEEVTMQNSSVRHREHYAASHSRAALKTWLANVPHKPSRSWGVGQRKTEDAHGKIIDEYRSYALWHPAELTNAHIVKAVAKRDNMGTPVVEVSLSNTGRTIFAKMSTESVGRCIAIVVDGFVRNVPVVQEPITGGQLWLLLPDMSTMTDARHLAAALAHPLPASIDEQIDMNFRSSE